MTRKNAVDRTTPCAVEGCSNDKKRGDLCGNHYNVKVSGRDPHGDYKFDRSLYDSRYMTSKTCTKCGEVKTREEFYNRPEGRLTPSCKACHNKVMKEYREEKRKAEREANPPKPKEIVYCSGPDCTDLARTKGLCQAHYQQQWNGHELKSKRRYRAAVDENNIKCYGCDEVKPKSEFYMRKRKDGMPNRRQSSCKTCMVKSNTLNTLIRDGRIADARDWLEDMPEPMRTKYANRYAAVLRGEGN